MPVLTQDEKNLIGSARQQEQERQDERYIAADLNAAMDEGSFFTVSDAATNKPYGSHSGILKVLKDNNQSSTTQVFHDSYGRAWMRISGLGDGSDWVGDDDWVETYDSARISKLENVPPPAPTPEYEPEVVELDISGKLPTRGECADAFKMTVDFDWTRNKTFFIEDTSGRHQAFQVIYIADGATSEADSGRFAVTRFRYRV